MTSTEVWIWHARLPRNGETKTCRMGKLMSVFFRGSEMSLPFAFLLVAILSLIAGGVFAWAICKIIQKDMDKLDRF